MFKSQVILFSFTVYHVPFAAIFFLTRQMNTTHTHSHHPTLSYYKVESLMTINQINTFDKGGCLQPTNGPNPKGHLQRL